MKKIIITSIYAAPYRYEVIKLLGNKFNEAMYSTFVFFQHSKHRERNSSWLKNNLPKNWFFLDKFGGFIKFIKNLVLFNNVKVLFLYDFSTISSLILFFRAYFSKTIIVLNNDGAFINNGKNLKNFIKKILIRRADLMFSSGNHANNYFIHYGGKEKKIINHPFTSLFSDQILKSPVSLNNKLNIRKKYGLSRYSRVVISVGNFITRKGFDLLIRAWGRLENNENNILLIVGEGPLKSDLVKLASNNNISNINFISFLDKETLFNYYKLSDFFVLYTREDIWGLVINEAMACGLPIITTDKCIAGLELIEENINGFILKIDDFNSHFEKIQFLIENLNLCEKFGNNNISKIKKYNYENVSKIQFENIIKLLT